MGSTLMRKASKNNPAQNRAAQHQSPKKRKSYGQPRTASASCCEWPKSKPELSKKSLKSKRKPSARRRSKKKKKRRKRKTKNERNVNDMRPATAMTGRKQTVRRR